jgi:hypothetical protein
LGGDDRPAALIQVNGVDGSEHFRVGHRGGRSEGNVDVERGVGFPNNGRGKTLIYINKFSGNIKFGARMDRPLNKSIDKIDIRHYTTYYYRICRMSWIT